MVRTLTHEMQQNLRNAILKAERESGTEIALVIAPASDAYMDVALFYGLLLGNVVALALWYAKAVTAFPALMCVVLLFTAAFTLVPALRHFCARFAPRHTRHHHAAQRACAEYVHASHHLATSARFLLIYVSLTERYVHIFSSRNVREKIPDREWDAVVRTLTGSIVADGVGQAALKAVAHAGEILKGRFAA